LAAQEGQLVDYLENDALETVLVIQGAPSKLQVVTQFGKQKTIKANQILCRFAGIHERGELAQILPALHKRIGDLTRDIDTEFLWSGTEPKEKDLSVQEIAGEYYGEAGSEEISAICRALLRDQIRFKRNGLAFQARSEAQVQTLLLAEEREHTKHARELAIGAWLKRIASAKADGEENEGGEGDGASEEGGGHPDGERDLPDAAAAASAPAPDPDAAQEKEFLQALTAFLLERRESDVSRVFCQTYQENPRESAFEILSRLDLLPADCNPIKAIAGINPEFSRKALAEADALAETGVLAEAPHPAKTDPLSPPETETLLSFEYESDRLDLTALPAFSIDDAYTMEIDDAFTAELTEKTIRIGIHIADVATLIPIQSALDSEAQSRTLTVYLPEEVFTMFPPRIGRELASLKQGTNRRAISLLTEFDAATLHLTHHEFRASCIRNTHRLTYDNANAILNGAEAHPLCENLQKAFAVAEKLKETRLANKAFLITRPELRVHVDDGNISLSVTRGESPAHTLVQEFMILYNSCAAKFAQKAKLPVIYRVQAKPDGHDFPLGQEIVYEPHTARNLLKRIRPARLSLEAGAHAGLGESAYIQVSSPIRRYSDLIMQRQLLAAVQGRRPVYEQGELYRVLAAVEDTSREISAIERRSVRFWALEYLAREPGRGCTYTAAAVLYAAGGTLVELEEYPLRAILEGARVPAGEKIQVRISHVDARRDVLQCVRV
jgi:exoribonuclease-2